MRSHLKKVSLLVSMALFLALTLSLLTAVTSFAAPASSSWAGITTGTANVRSGPTTGAKLVGSYASGTHVTVYASVAGQIVWGGISTWYRVSSSSSSPRYIYGGLVAHVSSGGTGGGSAPPVSGQGKVIVVNRATSVQKLYAYQNGKLVFTALVTTGSLYLQTPLGTWHVYRKLHDVMFTSMWPKGSPYYFAPEYVHYALEYSGPLYIHDATWRSVYGPGTDRPHHDPKQGNSDGSHGCVNTSLDTSKWLYNWAGIGTTVPVID